MLHPRTFIIPSALIAGALLAVAATTTTGATMPHAAVTHTTAGPVVIELYHSQGCSSCPPAEADLNAIANRGDVLALSFAVTYWDRLGWTDTFGSPLFTARQVDYARAGKGEVATPEFVINGTRTVVGADRRALNAAVAESGFASDAPVISINAGHVAVAGAANGQVAPATVWLVRYDPRTIDVAVRAGENGGRTLAQRNVVRELVRLGDWSGRSTGFALPRAQADGLASAVLVQRGTGGAIIAARKV
ncbi:DUF1223 domain-containing protein [Novosphingobium sp.]|uniref:DUF1223 domain-containing protein n=1 Tax=Novosphingobium sp. TaxID=1874826 RepID=UPI00333EAB21